MENKDDLISRRAVLGMLRDESVMHVPYEQYEANARKYLAEDMSKKVKSLPGQMTAAEAWEVARKICCDSEDGGLSYKHIMEIFDGIGGGSILNILTPEEVRERIEAWENGLKVGDVVEFNNGEKAVITGIDSSSEDYYFLCRNGAAFPAFIENLHKTGKTIDIQSVLEQLGE